MRIAERARDQLGRDRGVGALGVEQRDDPAGAVGVVERERALEPGAEDRRVHVELACALRDRAQVEERAEDDLFAPRGRGQDRLRAVRRREDQRVCTRLDELPRGRAHVEPLDPDGVPLAADDGALRLLAQAARILDLGAAKNAPVARGQRLGDRRRRAQDVDDDPERRGGLFLRREGDMDSHATRVR